MNPATTRRANTFFGTGRPCQSARSVRRPPNGSSGGGFITSRLELLLERLDRRVQRLLQLTLLHLRLALLRRLERPLLDQRRPDVRLLLAHELQELVLPRAD